MTAYETILKQQFDRGYNDAVDLRSRAADMDGTGVIAEESKVPVFEPDKDYSEWAVGSPVKELMGEEYQIYKWITPVNTAHYPGFLPSKNPAICSLCHTTDPKKAKAYVAPNGTSGLWMMNECCTQKGYVWQSLVNDGAYSPEEYPGNWANLGTIEEVQRAAEEVVT